VPRSTKREFDAIMAWSVDRLGRSLQDLVKFLTEIHALKIDLYLHQQGLDTTTPAGKMASKVGRYEEAASILASVKERKGKHRRIKRKIPHRPLNARHRSTDDHDPDGLCRQR